MNKLILIIALALVSTGAWGYLNMGYGTYGCGKYVAAKQNNSQAHYRQIAWVQGFITGGNAERERNGGNFNIGESLDSASIALWIGNYCRANPLEELTNAADALVEELQNKE